MVSGYNKNLCKYVISKEQKDLMIIFETFVDKVSDPETNVFFLQNEVLEKILKNIETSRKASLNIIDLYKGIDTDEKNLIQSLSIDSKIISNASASVILGITYFDEELFMEVLDKELNNIVTKYNLKANDDYNKMYKFLSSIQLTLQSSDDVLLTLKNQFNFFSEHAKSGKSKDVEVITIYGNKHYKIDILKNLLDIYNSKIQMQIKNTKTKRDIR